MNPFAEISKLVGPALGGLFIAVGGPGLMYSVDAVSFLALIVIVAFLRIPHVQPEQSAMNFVSSIKEGARFVKDRPLILHLIGLDLSAMIFAAYRVVLPALTVEVLDVGPAGYGLLAARATARGTCGGCGGLSTGGRLRPRGAAHRGRDHRLWSLGSSPRPEQFARHGVRRRLRSRYLGCCMYHIATRLGSAGNTRPANGPSERLLQHVCPGWPRSRRPPDGLIEWVARSQRGTDPRRDGANPLCYRRWGVGDNCPRVPNRRPKNHLGTPSVSPCIRDAFWLHIQSDVPDDRHVMGQVVTPCRCPDPEEVAAVIERVGVYRGFRIVQGPFHASETRSCPRTAIRPPSRFATFSSSACQRSLRDLNAELCGYGAGR